MMNISKTECIYSCIGDSMERFFCVWYTSLNLTSQPSKATRNAQTWATIAILACVYHGFLSGHTCVSKLLVVALLVIHVLQRLLVKPSVDKLGLIILF